jgi:hypothetical protein
LVVLDLHFCRRKHGKLNLRDETSHSNTPVTERADPRNALQYARQFDDFLSANGQFTIQAAADAFSVSKATVCYYSALIKRLPVELVTWLERTEDPRVLGFLTERRLRPITRLVGDNQILRLKSVLSTFSNELSDDDRLAEELNAIIDRL